MTRTGGTSATGESNGTAYLGLVVAVAGAVAAGFAAARWYEEERGRNAKTRDDEPNNNLDERMPAPRRFGGAVRLNPNKYLRYRELHDEVWPDVLRRMSRSNIRNFTIYYHEETNTLFSHYEWIGHWKLPPRSTKRQEHEAFDRDMKAISDDPVTRKWWKECEPCQAPFRQWPSNAKLLSDGGNDDWWSPLECVNHCGHWPTAYSNQRRDPDFLKLDDMPKKK